MTIQSLNDPAVRVDLSRDSDLQMLSFIHDERGGPRSAYAWAMGRIPQPNPVNPYMGDQFFTADLDTQKVEDFIIAFYTAYNARFGLTY
jgi:hypothetical protein